MILRLRCTISKRWVRYFLKDIIYIYIHIYIWVVPFPMPKKQSLIEFSNVIWCHMLCLKQLLHPQFIRKTCELMRFNLQWQNLLNHVKHICFHVSQRLHAASTLWIGFQASPFRSTAAVHWYTMLRRCTARSPVSMDGYGSKSFCYHGDSWCFTSKWLPSGND